MPTIPCGSCMEGRTASEGTRTSCSPTTSVASPAFAPITSAPLTPPPRRSAEPPPGQHGVGGELGTHAAGVEHRRDLRVWPDGGTNDDARERRVSIEHEHRQLGLVLRAGGDGMVAPLDEEKLVRHEVDHRAGALVKMLWAEDAPDTPPRKRWRRRNRDDVAKGELDAFQRADGVLDGPARHRGAAVVGALLALCDARGRGRRRARFVEQVDVRSDVGTRRVVTSPRRPTTSGACSEPPSATSNVIGTRASVRPPRSCGPQRLLKKIVITK